MKNRKALYIILAILILALSILWVSAIADAGNFSGGSDYGGGGYSGGSSDWGSGSGSSGYYYSSGGGAGSIPVVIAIVVIIFLVARAKGKVSTVVPPQPVTPTSFNSISELLQKDPNFSQAAMQDKISNLYVRMQNAWQDKNFEPMRPHMTDMLYNQFARQLDELIRANRTNYVERIAVLNVTLDGWTQDDVNDAIIATVNTRIVDYTVDDKTGAVVSGSKTAEKFMTYQWTLVRSKGISTPEREGSGRDGTVKINCPSCGAPTEINQSAKCNYCGSIISAKDYDWSISAIKGISQRTAGR